MNQKGFATLEVILMIVIIGILATVAIPRFGDVTTKANTAKIQADLSTLDNAIEFYFMENGSYPEKLSDLSNYIKDVANLKPPVGKANLKTGTELTTTSSSAYEITTTTNGETRATLDSHTAGEFGKQ